MITLLTDVNECEEGLAGCGENQVCENLYGAYRCVCKKNTVMINGKCEGMCGICIYVDHVLSA